MILLLLTMLVLFGVCYWLVLQNEKKPAAHC